MSSILTLQKRKAAFAQLGNYLLNPNDILNQLITDAQHYNAWFTPEQTYKSIISIGLMLNEQDLDFWFKSVTHETVNPKKVGLILAGNIPLVGFHDILSVLATGHIAYVKLSSQDKNLIPYILNKLVEFEPLFADRIIYTERLKDFNAVIATGSNNSSRYFEYYFGKVPHIIRKNRNSIAVLSGTETTEELKNSGKDIFDYFGLGCRNVSKFFVPEGYVFNTFFEAIQEFEKVGDHHKYNNNYDYNKSIYLVNRDQHLDNGFLLVKKDFRLSSPLAVLYFEEYKSQEELQSKLAELAEQIQCVVSNLTFQIPVQQVGFGQSQQPRLWDYADGIDTLKFLQGL